MSFHFTEHTALPPERKDTYNADHGWKSGDGDDFDDKRSNTGGNGLSLVENGTVDYLGRPADKSTTGGWLVAPLIFGAEMCERMAVFGISSNLVTYLVERLHLSTTYSANLVTNFVGTAFLTCLIGGFVADTWLGRFKTIAVAGTIQFTGLTLITLFASLPAFEQPPCDPPNVPCQPAHGVDLVVLYVALYLMALGTGGIKACVSAFGADQFDINDPRERKLMAYFFNWFFFFITMGALVAVTLLIYVQDKIGRGWGFGITSSCMLIAVVVFVAGRKAYRHNPERGSPFSKILRVIIAAVRKRRLSLPSDPATMLYREDLDSYNDGAAGAHRNGFQAKQKVHRVPGDNFDELEHTNQFLCLSKAAIIVQEEHEAAQVDFFKIMRSNESNGSNETTRTPSVQHTTASAIKSQRNTMKNWRERTSRTFGGIIGNHHPITVTQVEEVKTLIRLLPILFTTFLFWTVYAQMTTFSIEQAVIMNRRLSGNFEIPAASIGVFLSLTILIMITLYDRVLIRVMRRFTGLPQGITFLQRIGVGLVLSLLAMVAAALVEHRRRRLVHIRLQSESKAQVSVFWLLPQYILVGMGETFTYIGQLEFFYNESPWTMRSMGTALCLCTMSIGFYSSSFLVDVVDRFSKFNGDEGWLTNDLNRGQLDRFYWLLAFLSALNFVIYLFVAKWYTYRSPFMTSAKQQNVGIEVGDGRPERNS